MTSDLGIFYGPNAGYALELYERYREDPASVDPASRALFEEWEEVNGAGATVPLPRQTTEPPANMKPGRASAMPSPIAVRKIAAASRMARLIRELGHLAAHFNPLGVPPPGDPALELETQGLKAEDLAVLPSSVVGGPLAEGASNALEALGKLRQVYSGAVGYETGHIHIPQEREWLRQAIESSRFFRGITADDKRRVLKRLTEVETFERFLHQTFLGQKRFSIEGVDMLVPMLDIIISDAASLGTREVVMGMAHRGRLNVLAHILGKPYSAIVSEFQQAQQDPVPSVAGTGTHGWSGDVKYHLGARRSYNRGHQREMPITLAPNPSHLEFVDPVVLGRARAAQDNRKRRGAPYQDPAACLAILIHGDAAFPGQGIVAETLNMSQLPGYGVGGTIHVITNNQIGFTTGTRDARSTLYASDLAKGFEIPIVHVNADDPESCIAISRMAHAYRERFGKDFLIDLVGYRRWGHNEGDEPAYTQPRMYEVISAHPTVRQIWAKDLEESQVVTRDEAEDMVANIRNALQAARNAEPEPPSVRPPTTPDAVPDEERIIETAVSEERLLRLNAEMLKRPEGFTPNAKLERHLQGRTKSIQEAGGIDWSQAEALAFGSILEDSIPIRFTGQDTERGTFSQRHMALHDPTTGERFVPLQAVPDAHAAFGLYNSPLSENSTVGFEYGYSMHATDALVLWEAQFGDFSNSAQVIIDQFLISGQAKWQQTPSLALLLPHGYEGQGPEHSSARLERFLQLAANDNIRVVNCTTSAQYFHVLRRQAALLETDPKPLVIMTPKSLLRLPRAGSSISDLSRGHFQAVLEDESAMERSDRVTRAILCSGKVYYDLMASDAYAAAQNVAVERVEQLYPFPAETLRRILSEFPQLREVVWLQEEPRNMGAWSFVQPRLADILPESVSLRYVGRPESASPAEGSMRRHASAQGKIIQASVAAIPEPLITDAPTRREERAELAAAK